MDFEALRAAFLDELDKIAVAHGRMTVSKTRSGRRSISVGTMLKKEKEGELYKTTGDANKIAARLPDGSGFFTATVGKKKEKSSQFYGQSVPFSVGVGQPMGPEARKPRKKGDVPSREDMDELPKWEDRRGSAATVPGTGTTIGEVGVSNTDRA